MYCTLDILVPFVVIWEDFVLACLFEEKIGLIYSLLGPPLMQKEVTLSWIIQYYGLNLIEVMFFVLCKKNSDLPFWVIPLKVTILIYHDDHCHKQEEVMMALFQPVNMRPNIIARIAFLWRDYKIISTVWIDWIYLNRITCTYSLLLST